MKQIIIFLLAFTCTTVYSQKKDNFSFTDLENKFRLKDTSKNQFHADTLTAFLKQTYNFRGTPRTEPPRKSVDASWAIYEFYFKDGSNVYILVRHDMLVTEITHRYNYQGRVADFTTWTQYTGEISKGRL